MINVYDIILIGTGATAIISSFTKRKEIGLIALLIFFFFIILKLTTR